MQAKFCHWPRFMSTEWYALGLVNESDEAFNESREREFEKAGNALLWSEM